MQPYKTMVIYEDVHCTADCGQSI